MSNWKVESLEVLQKERDKLHKSDIAFYQIDRFERIIHRIDEFSDTCDECKSLQAEISSYLPRISEMLQGKAKDKRQYEKYQEKQMKHLAKTHQIYSFNYFVSKFALYGLIGGLLIGFLLASVFSTYFHQLWIGTTVIGLSVAYFAGNTKEMGLRRRNQII